MAAIPEIKIPVEFVETSNMGNKEFRTFSNTPVDQFPHRVYNELSMMPANRINLRDGRSLSITRWRPDGDCHELRYGKLTISFEGILNWLYEKPDNIENSPAAEFNAICHIPEGNIELGEARVMFITGWAPAGDMMGTVYVKVDGFVLWKE